jgi:hypothetical protein
MDTFSFLRVAHWAAVIVAGTLVIGCAPETAWPPNRCAPSR